MKKLRPMFLILSVIFAFLNNPSASKAFEITGLGGLTYGNFSQQAANIPVAWNSQASYSLGVLASTNFLILPFEIESGLMYTTYASQMTLTQEQWKTHWIQIPLVARFTLLDLIGVGVGGYVGIAQGSIDSTPISNVTTQYTYAQKGLNSTDAGLVLNARLQVPVAPLIKLVLDARYNHGFLNMTSTNATYPSDSFYNRFLLVLAGIQVGF